MSDDGLPERSQPLPPSRHGYLSEVSKCIRDYHNETEAQAILASSIQDLENSASRMRDSGKMEASLDLQEEADRLRAELGQEVIDSLSLLDQVSEDYSSGKTDYLVRGNKIEVNTTKKTLSGLDLPRVALPTASDWGDRVRWIRSENLPGAFPYLSLIHI